MDESPEQGAAATTRIPAWRDPPVALTAAAGVFSLLLYDLPILSEDARHVWARSSDLLLIAAVIAAFHWRGSSAARASPSFRGFWTAGLSCWAAVRLLDLAIPADAAAATGPELVRVVGYASLYLFAALSLELSVAQRPETADDPTLRSLEAAGALVLTTGLITYFAFIPALRGVPIYHGTIPATVLYLTFDLYLLARLTSLILRKGPWRPVYLWLLVAVAFWAGADATEALSGALGLAAETRGRLLDVLWLPPFLALTLAARTPLARDPQAGTGEAPARLHGVLLLQAAVLPFVHVFLEWSGAIGAATHLEREVAAFLVFALLGCLALSYQARIERLVWHRTGELRDANESLGLAVAALEEARDAAERANEEKSRFLAIMSHEIRTPMNGVLGMSQLLLQGGLEGSQRRLAETLLRSGESLLSIVNDLLDLSRLESGNLRLHPEPFDPERLIGEVADELAGLAREKGLELAVIVEALPREVVGDGHRFRQILVNLVGNAIKYTERGEVVVLGRCTRDESERVALSVDVADTGMGVDPELGEGVFEAFRRGAGRGPQGTGLGLAICRQLARLMGGDIEMESAPGKGSLFRLEVPFDRVAGVGPAEPVPELAGSRALVVDDDATARLAGQSLCASLGLDTDVAEDAHAALAALRQAVSEGRPYDFALIDLDMPDIDGETLMRGVSSEKALHETRLLALGTANAAGRPQLPKPLIRVHLEPMLRSLAAGEPVEEPNEAETPAAPLAGRVLVVDDSPVNAAVAEGMLGHLGLDVELAPGGRQGLEALGRQRYDAVLMDCMMPGMDGFDTTRELRRREASSPDRPRTPVIALTAVAMAGDRERCYEAGMDDYLSKPFTREQLERIMRRWLAPPDDGQERR